MFAFVPRDMAKPSMDALEKSWHSYGDLEILTRKVYARSVSMYSTYNYIEKAAYI